MNTELLIWKNKLLQLPLIKFHKMPTQNEINRMREQISNKELREAVVETHMKGFRGMVSEFLKGKTMRNKQHDLYIIEGQLLGQLININKKSADFTALSKKNGGPTQTIKNIPE
jgi:hypothetical protein